MPIGFCRGSHAASVAQAARTHADHLAQILAQHQQHAQTQHDPATPSDDALRSALLEQTKLQREVTEATAEHIGALTTTVADLGQTVGMLAVAAVLMVAEWWTYHRRVTI